MVLYSKDGCGPCKTVKYMLDKLGVDYEERNVTEPLYFEELAKYATSVPVVVKGDKYVIGPNLAAIKQLVV